MTVPPSDPPRTSDPPKSRGERRVLPRKFYARAAAVKSGDAWQITLDGRSAKTPGKRPLAIHSQAVADKIATEWAAQGEHIDPATMPLTTLACSAIDAVALQPDAVAADIVKYAGTDLLCYRSEGPDALIAAEAAAWDPVLDWAARDLGAVFALSTGLTHTAQSPTTLQQINRAVGQRAPLSLAALHVLTTLTGSAVLALAVDRGHLSIAEAWAAAHVDDDWQIARWGDDAEAATRRANRRKEAEAAAFALEAFRTGA